MALSGFVGYFTMEAIEQGRIKVCNFQFLVMNQVDDEE